MMPICILIVEQEQKKRVSRALISYDDNDNNYSLKMQVIIINYTFTRDYEI